MHLKTLAAPRTWKVARKARTWLTRPRPGPHKAGLPLGIALRLLGLARTAREVRLALNKYTVTVNARRRRQPGFPLGFGDILSAAGQAWLVWFDAQGKLLLRQIKQASQKLAKVVARKPYRGAWQISLHDGSTLLLRSPPQLNSTLILSLPGLEVLRELRVQSGSPAIVIAGSHIGKTGLLEERAGRLGIVVNGSWLACLPRQIFVLPEGYP